jgi:hypothetical protein
MSESSLNSLPIVVLSCQVFQNWLENLLPAEAKINITFFDYGLHKVPKNLRQTIQSAINSIEQPSLVLLGYGLCGNGLDNINAGRHYLLIPRTDDCIAILLGSYPAYKQQMEKQPGTYYLSKGWLESGSNPLMESQELEKKYGPEKTAWLMDYQYHNYKRLMLVARNQQEVEHYRSRALEVAEYCARWGMKYEEILGSDEYLEKFAAFASKIDHDDNEFLLIPPGGLLTQSQFMRE